MSIENDLLEKTRVAGQAVFIISGLAVSLFLLSQIGHQTVWVEDAKNLPSQPRFWPAVALVTMTLGFGLHLWRMKRRRPDAADRAELRQWLAPFEHAGWFMLFVFAVPAVGFLPSALAFACGLTWRLGYRGARWQALAAVFAVVTVLFFKGLLGVRIPGAAIYEYLPGALRSFFILYL